MATAPTLPDLPHSPALIVRDDGSWFENSLGTLAGRVALTASEFAVVLGQLESAEFGTFDYTPTPSYVQISQDIDVTDLKYIEFPSEIIGRVEESASFNWTAYILIDGVVHAQRDIKTEKEVTWSTFRAPVAHLTGTVTVTVRLALRAI